MTWTATVARALAAAGNRTVAIGPDGTSWTGLELTRRAAGATAVLDGAGCPRDGTPVAALLSTGLPALAFLHAGAASRRPLAPLGTRLTAREVAACVAPLGARVLLAERAAETLGREVAAVCGCELVVVDGVEPRDTTLSDEADSTMEVAATVGLDDVAYVLHTSGTTGAPKRAPTRQRHLVARTELMAGLYDLDEHGVFAATSPFHHVAGLGVVAVTMAVGATFVGLDAFTVEAFTGLSAYGVTHVATISTVVEMLVRAAAFTASSVPTLRCLSYGSSPMRVETMRGVLAEHPDVAFITWYGQTEGSPITYLSPDDHRRAVADDRDDLLATVGRPVPGGEIAIREPDGDGIGEILARAPHMVVVDAEGWRATGDLGFVDAEGLLHLVGRKGDMIIRGGENVYPAEVEAVLGEHAAVAEAVVAGIADERLGETVAAWIRPADAAAPPSTEELRAFARERLAGFKVPVVWRFVATIPRNVSGKPLRRELTAVPLLGPSLTESSTSL
jgi:acyl-CoA synthetase (AMP-forming)/AMP-acid ligase II